MNPAVERSTSPGRRWPRPDLPESAGATVHQQGGDHVTLLPDSRVGLPPVVERLLLDVVAEGFTVYCCGPRAAPTALAASYDWQDYVDHITIRRWDQVTAARMPKLGRVDVFAPEVVVWAYEGPAECTLRALLTLVHPQHPDAPTGVYPAPRSLLVPRHEQRPMSIRLPSASRTGARAARLAGLP
ncbi:MAG: hypothetical protein ACRDS1_15760 [Pseudonocardiaceae bacterium]